MLRTGMRTPRCKRGVGVGFGGGRNHRCVPLRTITPGTCDAPAPPRVTGGVVWQGASTATPPPTRGRYRRRVTDAGTHPLIRHPPAAPGDPLQIIYEFASYFFSI